MAKGTTTGPSLNPERSFKNLVAVPEIYSRE